MLSLFLGLLLHSQSSIGFEMYKSRVAVDYGPRNIGVAVGFGEDIQPLRTLSNHGNLTVLAGEIINIARTHGASELIVGVPVDRDGVTRYNIANLNGIMSLNFSSVLASCCQRSYPRARVLIMDERYTTREAKAKSQDGYAKSSLDAVSAACLLERFIEDEGEFNVLPALPCPYPPPKDLEWFDYGIVQRHIRLTKYSMSDMDYSSESIKSRKFGVYRRLLQDEDTSLNYVQYSFNAIEFFRMQATQTSSDEPETVESAGGEQENEEESEDERQFRIRAMRRKKGTLKRLS